MQRLRTAEPDDAQDDTVHPALGRARRVLSTLLFVLVPIALLTLIAGAIAYFRLSHGPVSLRVFAPHIERGISAELGKLQAHVDDVTLNLAEGGGLEFRLSNLSLSEPDGDLVASAPLAAIELSRSALFMLRVVPERVYLIEPRLSLTYSEESGLALSFSGSSAAGAGASPEAHDDASGKSPGTSVVAKSPNEGQQGPMSPFHRIDLARVIAESAARARSGVDATSKLREIGVRNATVIFEHRGKSSEWQVSEAAIDLEHMKRRSVISGAARISSSRGPWILSFRTEDLEKRNAVKVTTSVRNLVPSTLASAAPELSLFETLDMPVTADVSLDLATSGELKEVKLALDLSSGHIHLPSMTGAPLTVDGGRFELVYDAPARRLAIAPSTLRWGDSHITLAGEVIGDTGPAGDEWKFSLKAKDGVFAAEEFNVAGIPVDAFEANGLLVPEQGHIELSAFNLEAGGAKVTASAEITTGTGTPSTRIDAQMSPMSLPTLKALWPRAVSTGARQWVGKHFRRGTLRSGTFKLASGSFLKGEEPPQGATERISLAVEAGDLEMVPLPEGLPVTAPRALISLENDTFEVTVPEAALIASPTRQVPIKNSTLTIASVTSPVPMGELVLHSQTTLAAVIDTMSRSRIVTSPFASLPTDGVDGKIDGEFKITMPMVPGTGATVKTEGKARITELRSKNRIGPYELHGGSIDIDASETAVNASGEMLLNGVLAKLEWQHILDAPDDTQLPLRLTARLDNSDRSQLGLDLNHLVQGEVPIEISVARGPAGEPLVHARADLTNAELSMRDIAWRKAQGRPASLEFDVAKGLPDAMTLENFRITGDNIAIEGNLTLDAENEVREFNFPSFSLNVVSRLDVHGKLGNNKIWTIKARGSTYDGKDLFRSMLALGQPGDVEVKPRRPAAGMDVEAEIDTVLGHSNTTLRGFKLKLSERNDQLVGLDAQGTLDGNKPLAVLLKRDSSGQRVMYADSTDAGQAFKLVGFYPNMQGGRVRLEVNLDGRGAAEKTGILWVDDFRVLGDPVVSEVYSSAGGSGPVIDSTPQGQRRVVREVFEFDKMKAPFSLGHGQFVLEESYVKGPILGASIRGKVDYNAQRVNLGGTYVPLQGINSALCDIPVFGPIVSGLKCEGVFGITYAIQGPMAQPQVIVNPLSMFTPGILRGIMEMTSPNPKVQPRDGKQKSPVQDRVRSSSSDAAEGSDRDGGAAIDGWTSDTIVPSVPKKK